MALFRRKKRRVVSASYVAAERLLQSHARPCWLPQIGKGHGTLVSSRFGGRPALLPDESSPQCAACHCTMRILAQVNLSEVPSGARLHLPPELQSGLLQLFYCTDDQCPGGDFGHFSENMLARVLPHSCFERLKEGDGHGFSEARILDWQEAPDLPSPEEALSLGVVLTDDQCDEFYGARSDSGESVPRQGDKLLGWPDWVQGMFHPECPDCHRRMKYVLQIASEDHVPFMFGDCGVGHVCVCPLHQSRAAFFWSCC